MVETITAVPDPPAAPTSVLGSAADAAYIAASGAPPLPALPPAPAMGPQPMRQDGPD